jgi:predicted metal-dependent hydrolase
VVGISFWAVVKMNDNMKAYLTFYIHQWCGRLGIAMPEVKFRKMRFYGNCNYTDRIITINSRVANRYDLEDTCRHEIAHLTNGTHNKRFLESMQKLGSYRGMTYPEFQKLFR